MTRDPWKSTFREELKEKWKGRFWFSPIGFIPPGRLHHVRTLINIDDYHAPRFHNYESKRKCGVKSLVDTRANIKAVVSGSAAAALKLKSDESGAGRFTDILLPPLTFYEYLELLNEGDIVTKPNFQTNDIKSLNEKFIYYLNFGGYPEVIFSPQIQSDPARFIKSDIIDKVLLRDLPSLYGISDIQELNYLFTTLAFNTANEVSLEELSKNSGVAKNTIKNISNVSGCVSYSGYPPC